MMFELSHIRTRLRDNQFVRRIFGARVGDLSVRPVCQRRISVVIPTLNEAERIGIRLSELARQSGIHEVIVVDGGSDDGTVAIVRRHAAAGSGNVCLIDAERGRASQMNAGAEHATGHIVLFLHADVSLPDDAARWVIDTLAIPHVVAGAFRTWTVPDLEGSWLAPFLHLADLRSRYSGLPYGDQAIFAELSAFRMVGGFPDIPLMEDLELSKRLRSVGQIRTARASVRVSGRRFLARPIYYTTVVNVLPALHALGVPMSVLTSLYRYPADNPDKVPQER